MPTIAAFEKDSQPYESAQPNDRHSERSGMNPCESFCGVEESALPLSFARVGAEPVLSLSKDALTCLAEQSSAPPAREGHGFPFAGPEISDVNSVITTSAMNMRSPIRPAERSKRGGAANEKQVPLRLRRVGMTSLLLDFGNEHRPTPQNSGVYPNRCHSEAKGIAKAIRVVARNLLSACGAWALCTGKVPRPCDVHHCEDRVERTTNVGCQNNGGIAFTCWLARAACSMWA